MCGYSLLGRIEGEREAAVAHAYKPIILYDGSDEEEALFALLSLQYGVALCLPGRPHFLESVDARSGLKLIPATGMGAVHQFALRRSALIRAYQMPEEAAPAPHVPKLWKNLRLTAWGIRERVLDWDDLPQRVREQVDLILNLRTLQDEEELPTAHQEFRFLDIR